MTGFVVNERKAIEKTHLINLPTIFTVYNQYLQTWSKTIQSSTLINKKASVLLLQQWFMQSRVPAVVIDSSPDSSSGPLTTYAWTTSRVTLHSMQPNANMYIKSVLSITCQNVIQQWSNASADTPNPVSQGWSLMVCFWIRPHITSKIMGLLHPNVSERVGVEQDNTAQELQPCLRPLDHFLLVFQRADKLPGHLYIYIIKPMLLSYHDKEILSHYFKSIRSELRFVWI